MHHVWGGRRADVTEHWWRHDCPWWHVSVPVVHAATPGDPSGKKRAPGIPPAPGSPPKVVCCNATRATIVITPQLVVRSCVCSSSFDDIERPHCGRFCWWLAQFTGTCRYTLPLHIQLFVPSPEIWLCCRSKGTEPRYSPRSNRRLQIADK